jgi:Asp-tRNA(Asn)/Glu-tRNA(Gln) amidotransferase A subunit family amidase
MPESPERPRRSFLVASGAACATAALARFGTADGPAPSPAAAPQEEPPGAGPDDPAAAITPDTIREAERLAGVTFTPAERETLVKTIAGDVKRFVERRTQDLPNGLAPAQTFDAARAAGAPAPAFRGGVVRAPDDGAPLPTDETEIAFAPVSRLSRWIERRRITSRGLTELYLRRLDRLAPRLECCVTVTDALAREQADRADAEIAAGRYRGPLHGIPWGAKDLFDTAGLRTTWGATPYRERVAETDAAVVRRLRDAGAVLVAKTTLGALAYGDIWFDGKTRNPWNVEQGSSGSSAGSAAATAAGLMGFSLGTETLGSIVSPCMRCGTTGLRPTFGRVARTGAMALCWSLDKIGPICRTAEDTALVLDAINGADAGDASSVDAPFRYDAGASVRGLRLGYHPSWFEGGRHAALERPVLEAAERAGLRLVECALPEWPYGTLMTILHVEAAAAFEELTLTDRDDELVWQEPEAWPNSFRQTRFTPAIEYVQAERFRRRVSEMMAERFADVDAMISPSYAAALLLITNCTGHPSLTLRCGFRENGAPHGITVWGRLFDEGTICRIGAALERELNVWDRRPPE